MVFNKRLLILLIFIFAPLQIVIAATQTHTAQFLSMADIHFDPFISCHHQKPCPLIENLRAAPSSEWANLLAQSDKNVSQFRQDTSYFLLMSALSAAKKASVEKQAEFVFILGDFLSHDYRRYYAKYSSDKTMTGYTAFVKKTLEFINIQLANTFPHVDIYSVVGNNDSYRNDYFSYPNSPFFQETAIRWSALIKNQNNQSQMQKQFREAGYYALDLKPGLRLIVLNTVLFSTKARGKNIAYAARRELAWLDNELAKAKARKQKVFIAMHIPMGIDVYASLKTRLFKLVELWKGEYSSTFQEELQHYAPIISAIFAGHLHSDWFHMLDLDKASEIPVTGTPAVSPIFGNNPGFKIYSYNPDTFVLEDFLTYYYPLTNGRAWGIEYDFNQIYQSHCHECQVKDNLTMLQRVGSVAGFYRLFHADNTQVIQPSVNWTPYYWCAIKDSNIDAAKICN